MVEQWLFETFAQKPHTSEDQVRAARMDIVIAAMMGLLMYHEGGVQLAEYMTDT